jgi:hypothetical protein
MKRTTLAVALATGALAVPAVALAAGGDNAPTQAPSATPTPQQRDQAPRRGHDCPNHDGGGDSSGNGGQSSGSGSGGQTSL